MGVLLYERKARLVLDTLIITDLRIQFKVRRTLVKEPNTCEVSVSNLNEQHRSAFQKKLPKVILEAGYPDNIAQLFSGDARYVDQVLQGATWTTKLQCGDGERAYRYLRVNESFAPGTRVADVVSKVASAAGMQLTGQVSALQSVTEQFLQGYCAFGKVAAELDHLLVSRGFTWSIQDGKLQILQRSGAVTGDSIIRLATDTGMVGSPEHGSPFKQGPAVQVDGNADDDTGLQPVVGPAILKVKSLLQPGFRPGRRVQIQSKGVNGLFQIQTVEHSGDTFGGEWYSDLECLPADSFTIGSG